ncbi:MAG: hypothetical protein Q7R41_05480 [Phycisphaerales bacterium]|nr:hypothetical protein [Phycisphaerales bacterium]
MSILSRFFETLTGHPDYADQILLKEIFDTYSREWPDNSDLHNCWKPDTILPAPKWAVKRAMKLCYAEWPEPIDWTVFKAFFMEFVDLALHLPADDYAQIERFRKGRIIQAKLEGQDPLKWYTQSSSLVTAMTMQNGVDDILRIRDEIKRSEIWDPIDADDDELDSVRRILLESEVEFASLTQEWRFYILSIGREKYIEDSAPH